MLIRLVKLLAGRDPGNLLWELTHREVTAKYHGARLGQAWTLLAPVFLILIYYVFLRNVGETPITDTAVGIFAWQCTIQSIMGGLGCITDNPNLVKKVALNRVLLPLAVTLANFRIYLLTWIVQGVLFVAMMIRPGEDTFQLGMPLLGLPLVMALHLLFNFGLALWLGALNVVARDLQHLIGVALTGLFFVTPAMYNTSFPLFAETKGWLMLNPMAFIITAYRQCVGSSGADLLQYPWFSAGALLLIGLTFAVGWTTFHRRKANFADYL